MKLSFSHHWAETAAATVRSEIEMYYVCLNIEVQVLFEVYIWVCDWVQSVLISQVLTAGAQMKWTVRVSMTDALIKETIITNISPPYKRSHILKTHFRHKIIPLRNTFQLIHFNVISFTLPKNSDFNENKHVFPS